MAANKGAGAGAEAGGRPHWFQDGMDPDSTYNLEMRIIARHTRARWFSFNEFIDADRANFRDLVADVEQRYPGDYGDVMSVFYFSIEGQRHIKISTDQELLDMFEKNKVSKSCYVTFCYHSPTTGPPEIPPWDFSTSWQSLDTSSTQPESQPQNQPESEPQTQTFSQPLTPSMTCPSIAQPSQTQSVVEDDFLCNPNPNFEHVGGDEEGLYLDLGPKKPAAAQPNIQGGSKQKEREEESDGGHGSASESDDDTSDDDDADYVMEDVDDDIVKDREPDHLPVEDYDRKNPPLTVGSVYRDMHAFKMALASHAVVREFHYDIEKSDTGRYRVYCSDSHLGCKWRIHASTMKGDKSIKVKRNPEPHTCQSKRRSGTCVGVTQHWVCEQVLDWLKEDATVGATELQRRLKDEWKVLVPYRKVWHGKNLALDKLYGPWNESFDNLYRFKAQIDVSCPGSFVVIDHHTVNNKIRFNRFFFALKPCVDGFLRACRPYLAIDSTFLCGKFRGQLCVACAVDAHNWMYPVAVGVIDAETNENWCWFMERLRDAIGTPSGLTICTDSGQAVMHGVSEVFPSAEHRECMYHLVQNFKKRYSGKIFDDHLWQSSYSWSEYMFKKHYNAMAEAKPEAMKYLQVNHTKLWTRSQYGTQSKIDYVTNNLAESFNNWIKSEKAKHIDDFMDTLRQMLLIKWNARKKVANKFSGKILPHVMQQLREDSFNLDIDIITEHDGVAEVCAKGGTGFRFVVDTKSRTCSCRAWDVSGIPCKHAIAYITSLPGGNLEDHVDECYSVAKFKAAYEGAIPAIPDKSMWPAASHGFFMHPPLLKSTGGRRKNRFKGALEGGSKKKGRRHQCQVCKQLGHHWYTCKNGSPEDIAAMQALRGLPKKRQKKAAQANTETQLVVSTRMMFPPNEAVQNAVHKKRKRNSSSSTTVSKNQGATPSTSLSTHTPITCRSATGSNNPADQPVPLQVVSPDPPQASAATVQTPKRRVGVKKKLTPRRDVATTPARAACSKPLTDPASPAANTRSRKQLQLK